MSPAETADSEGGEVHPGSEPGAVVVAASRSRGSAVAVFVALGVIGVAGVVIYQNLPDELWRSPSSLVTALMAATPPDAQAAVLTDAKDPADVHSLLMVTPGKDGAPAVVSLGRPVAPETFDAIIGTTQDLLDRELIRQAVLIAARDELGLSTRDELLDDARPATGEGEAIEVSTLFRREHARALFRRGEGDAAKTLLLKDLGRIPDQFGYQQRLAGLAESFARTDFTELLKQLGLKGEPNKILAEAPLPAGVEEKMDGLGLVENFAAVRALHATIRAEGESPERLGALARAYAQLGALTGYQWSAAHRAFDARAILYAERLVARAPGSAWALRNRAFVRALIGFHAFALEDLDAARKLDESAKNPSPPPDWVEVIDACLKYDMKRLDAQKGPHARLAAYLKMMALEFPNKTRAGVKAARAVLEAAPDCCRAYDVICENGDLGDQHKMTVFGPQVFEQLFPANLKALTDLPKPVRESLDQPADELALVKALADAGKPGVDAGELSWGVLAHLAREARFVHVWRRLHFMVNLWAVPADEYWEEVQPLVANHRYRAYLESMGNPSGGAQTFSWFADRIDMTDLETNQQLMTSALARMRHPVAQFIWGSCIGHSTAVARDFSAVLSASTTNQAKHANVLRHISPHSPFAMSTSIQFEWDAVKNEVAAWKEKAGDSPALLGALGKKYFDLKQYDEAEASLKRYMELSPDQWAYQWLAACYEAKGDHDRWKATLDEFLTETEDSGLEHARVRVQIANSFMAQNRWAEAKEYAEPAAETWAGWAMLCAGEANERLEDWEQAELWHRRTTERYPTFSWDEWYRFCMRTGHGDLADARAYAEALVTAASDRPDLVSPATVGYFHWLNGEPSKAIGPLDAGNRAESVVLQAASLMLLADELNDKDRRDAYFKELCTTLKDKAPKTSAICQLLSDSLADDGKTPLVLAPVDEILASIPAETRCNTDFIVGKFLLNRGRTDEARPYLQRCAESRTTFTWTRAIAATSLRAPTQAKSP